MLDQNDQDPIISNAAIERWRKLLAPVKRYHQHTVEGLEHIPLSGGCLLVVHHSLATYDGFLYGLAINEHTGRVATALGDDLIFKTPLLKDLAWDSGIRPASPQSGFQLLKAGHAVFVSPGGMWESLRPSDEARTVRWENRRGFCRLALRAQVPLVLAACPAADDIYSVRKSRLTDTLYQRFRIPLPIAKGVGRTLIPRPVKLTHYVAPPIVPPPHEPQNEEQQIAELHAEATRVMHSLLQREQSNG
ncbi:MAG: lysophospholipid acyltransferase family protein [Myxococcota bacterium]